MTPADRASLGKAGRTADECRTVWERGQEAQLQKIIANFLNLREIYFEVDRMDKRPRSKGRPDFRVCYRGRWIGIECKADGGKLSTEQGQALAKIRANGGVTIVAFGLPTVIEALRQIDAQMQGR